MSCFMMILYLTLDFHKDMTYATLRKPVHRSISGYISKMRRRDEELSKGWGQIVYPLQFRQ